MLSQRLLTDEPSQDRGSPIEDANAPASFYFCRKRHGRPFHFLLPAPAPTPQAQHPSALATAPAKHIHRHGQESARRAKLTEQEDRSVTGRRQRSPRKSRNGTGRGLGRLAARQPRCNDRGTVGGSMTHEATRTQGGVGKIATTRPANLWRLKVVSRITCWHSFPLWPEHNLSRISPMQVQLGLTAAPRRNPKPRRSPGRAAEENRQTA